MKTYYLYKSIFEHKYQDTSFINKNFIMIDTLGEMFITIKIKDEQLIDRIIKIHKIKKEDSELGNFILFLKQKEVGFKTVIEELLQNPLNKYYYNDYSLDDYVKYSNSDYSRYNRNDF